MAKYVKLYASKWTKIGGDSVTNRSSNSLGYFCPYKSTQGINTNTKTKGYRGRPKHLNFQIRQINLFQSSWIKGVIQEFLPLSYLTPPNAMRKMWTHGNETNGLTMLSATSWFKVTARGRCGAQHLLPLGKLKHLPSSGLWTKGKTSLYVLFWNSNLQAYTYFGKQSWFKIGWREKQSFPQTYPRARFPPPHKQGSTETSDNKN